MFRKFYACVHMFVCVGERERAKGEIKLLSQCSEYILKTYVCECAVQSDICAYPIVSPLLTAP